MYNQTLKEILGALAIMASTCVLIAIGAVGVLLMTAQSGSKIKDIVITPYFDDHIAIADSKLPVETELTEEIPLIPAGCKLPATTTPFSVYLTDKEYFEKYCSYPEPPLTGTIEEQIQQVARSVDYWDEDLLLNLAYCESTFRPLVRGDNGHSRGLFQISDIYHPEVSDECSFSVRCSTLWTIQRIKDGYGSEWTCMETIKDWI